MKPILALSAVVLFAVTAFAGPTERYIVGVAPAADAIAVAARAVDAPALGARHFRAFHNLGSFSADLTAEEASALRRDASVRFVEQAIRVHAFATPAHRSATLRNPNVQTTPWGITSVDASPAWSATRGESVNVAVVDTGIDYTHPDLANAYAGGFCAMSGTTDPMDDNGHGTHVAGTIAAADNDYGVVGVAPHAKLWAVKVLGSDGSGTTTDISSGFDWVIAKKKEIGGNWIINMSWGICSDPTDFSCASKPPQALVDACQKAADAGILLIAAAGNDSTADQPAPVAYPAAFPTVVAIGAVDPSGNIADFSDQGPELAAVAPGVDVLSTYLLGQGANSYIGDGTTAVDATPIQGSNVERVTGRLVFCGFGAAAGDFPPQVKGNVALMERGAGVSFDQKTKNAVAAGAAGVVIYDCSTTSSPATCPGTSNISTWSLINTLPDGTEDPTDISFAWPVALGASNATGLALRSMQHTTVTVANIPDDYELLSGTSMASPHAVGAAALVWSAAPNATAAQVKAALLASAHDLGKSGPDPVFGAGLLDAAEAVKVIAPQLAPQIGAPPAGGRPFLRRGGH